MTAILHEIRQLDAARKRGDISAEEYATARGRLLASVEDAAVEPQEPARHAARGRPAPRRPAARAARPTPKPPSAPSEGTAPDDMSGFWALILIGLCAAGLMTFLVGQLIGDITIALTLAVTVFAAIVIAAFQRMQG
ncbi:SHOCT domain-containing protein [Phaeobacter sp. HF9A]|uniref:SHOCT domain-containing protein n=1 Tax=Phaeobacter sp. HF9A TaxID=2721561 RepID=UPI001430ADAC|nr:SHOCT domain-containing protein [Phaeobacter sp. HF9A]NIZ14200.1 SHOCT domain-containing protein [Phaeobacter sp. HF9A]